MAYVSRSSSGDFLEIWPDLAKLRVWEGRNLAVWIFSGVRRGWDPSGWICIDVRTQKNLIISLFEPFGNQLESIFLLLGGSPWGGLGLDAALLAPIGPYLQHLAAVPRGSTGVHIGRQRATWPALHLQRATCSDSRVVPILFQRATCNVAIAIV